MSEGRPLRFDVSAHYWADGIASEGSRAGTLYHIARNFFGSGSTSTPIGYYFCWRPLFIENFHPHWRVDCFVREHKLSPPPMKLARELVQALIREGLCSEPIWVSAHRSKELEGEALGEVFDLD